MIGALFAALQIAAAAPAAPAALVISDGQHAVRVPLVASANGPLLRVESLDPMLPVSVHHDSSSYYTISVNGARLQVSTGSQVVRVGKEVRPLASAPLIAAGHLLVPLQLVSEVFPSVVPNTRWDADKGQLVLFTPFGDDVATGMVQQAGEPVTPRDRSPSPGSNHPLPPIPPKRAGRRLVIVDAGHGGVDNGMTGPIGDGPRIREKDITLAVALKLGKRLRARGVDVVYTRTTDTLIALDDRGRIANKAGGDLFISIHVNAANPTWKDPGAARGFETYFLAEAHTEDARRVEQMENESVRFEGGPQAVDRNDPLGFILSDMQQNEHLRESSELAETIQDRLARMHPGPNRGVKQAGFRVLVTAYMPAVLVEIGFGTNAREAAYLADPVNQNAIADAIAAGAMEYLRGYERRVAGATATGPTP